MAPLRPARASLYGAERGTSACVPATDGFGRDGGVRRAAALRLDAGCDSRVGGGDVLVSTFVD